MEDRAEVLLPLRDPQVALFAAGLDAGLALAEAAVGEDAADLLIPAGVNQAGRGLALRFIHPQRHRITARDRAERLVAARRGRMQAEYLMGAGLPVARIFHRRRPRDLCLRLSFDAGLARLPLQRRA